ncbi:hypothetical protein HDU79_008271 [Rhizoclosmatium sp. JEL0117]|nr:hypothetical protein HDU79_008271 [Rhizoclosmatium sp. JEL0117]
MPSLVDLRTLSFEGCGIAGPLPDIWDAFPSLSSLNLKGNHFTAPLPPSFHNLRLRSLKIDSMMDQFPPALKTYISDQLDCSGSDVPCLFDFSDSCLTNIPRSNTLKNILVIPSSCNASPRLRIITSRDNANAGVGDNTLLYIMLAIGFVLAALVGTGGFFCYKRYKEDRLINVERMNRVNGEDWSAKSRQIENDHSVLYVNAHEEMEGAGNEYDDDPYQEKGVRQSEYSEYNNDLEKNPRETVNDEDEEYPHDRNLYSGSNNARGKPNDDSQLFSEDEPYQQQSFSQKQSGNGRSEGTSQNKSRFNKTNDYDEEDDASPSQKSNKFDFFKKTLSPVQDASDDETSEDDERVSRNAPPQPRSSNARRNESRAPVSRNRAEDPAYSEDDDPPPPPSRSKPSTRREESRAPTSRNRRPEIPTSDTEEDSRSPVRSTGRGGDKPQGRDNRTRGQPSNRRERTQSLAPTARTSYVEDQRGQKPGRGERPPMPDSNRSNRRRDDSDTEVDDGDKYEDSRKGGGGGSGNSRQNSGSGRGGGSGRKDDDGRQKSSNNGRRDNDRDRSRDRSRDVKKESGNGRRDESRSGRNRDDDERRGDSRSKSRGDNGGGGQSGGSGSDADRRRRR